MTVSRIPLSQVPSQSVNALLAGQPCTITLRDLGNRQYLSISRNGAVIATNLLLQNNARILMSAYTDFVGDLAVIDLQGDAPPQYTGWGTRWVLVFSDDA